MGRDCLAIEEDPQVGNAAVVDVGIDATGITNPGISPTIALHIFMDQLLEINSNSTIHANDLLVQPGTGWNITSGIRDSYVGSIVANHMRSAFASGGDEAREK